MSVKSTQLHPSCFAALCALHSYAQGQTSTVNVEVRAEQKPVNGAEVTLEGHIHKTDQQGKVLVAAIPGTVDLTVTAKGTRSLQSAEGTSMNDQVPSCSIG